MPAQETPVEAKDTSLHDAENTTMNTTLAPQVSDLPRESQSTGDISGGAPPIHTKRNAGKSLTGKTANEMGWSQ